MRSRQRISEHIGYTEATKSNTATKHGIDNTPDAEAMLNMQHIAKKIFEPLRDRFKVPIAVSSFYRSKELNKKIGGSSRSQHCKGEAMDLDADVYGMVSNRELFYYIKNNLEFDQLIWEFGTDYEPAWVHVSLKRNGINRNKVLKAVKVKDWKNTLITKYQNM